MTSTRKVRPLARADLPKVSGGSDRIWTSALPPAPKPSTR